MGSIQRVDIPLISLIIPVYNVRPYIKKCLDSVINKNNARNKAIALYQLEQTFSQLLNE